MTLIPAITDISGLNNNYDTVNAFTGMFDATGPTTAGRSPGPT